MFKNLGLRTKIFFLVSTVVIVSFVLLTIIVSYKSYEMAKKDAFNLAQETADKYKNEIIAELQGARITAETLATVFETLKSHDLTDRDMMNDILKNALAEKEYITAFCIAYDPDALDGQDGRYAGVEPAYDETGRYAPYWNKLGGNIAVEPLYDIDIADWYIVPKTERHEYITDPYPYEVQGHPVMLASLVFPIVYQERFIGIISSDIVLDKLQEMVSKVNPYGQGGYTEIFSNAGAVVAHPDKDYLGKDLTEALAYEMVSAAGGAGLDLSLMTPELAQETLRRDPDRLGYATAAKEAIRDGEPYTDSSKDFYTVYMPIQFSSVTNPWSVAVSIPMSQILDNANGIRDYVIIVSLIAICVIALILYLIAKNVTKPILILSDTAKILGEGNFDTEVPLIQSNDEIGDLSKAFKFMAAKINELVKEMQQYAKTLEEKNVYLNRLNELKDEFLANTSHELRTPINGIIGIVESMIDGATGPLSDGQKYNLAIVSNSGKRLSNMINDILDFTKLKNQEIVLQIKPIDLKTIVDTVIILSKPLIKGKELTLVNEIDESLTAVNADENRIQQILYNLIGNAIKFTEKGKVSVSARLEGGMTAISVEDTGIGIAADKFERIFESFEQADGSTAREYGGTGLGLSITKKIVELHGGAISVESKLGEGSKFTFTVPTSNVKSDDIVAAVGSKVVDIEDFAAAMPTAAERDGDGAADESGRRVLIVDDEPVNIQVLNNLLKMRDYAVTAAYNGADALRLIEEGEKFDLILLDVMMPKMSGYEVCRHLRETYTLFDLPIVMLTAKNQIQDILLGFQSGANDYIQKPFDKEELLARVRTLLELKSAMSAAMAANKAKSLFLANMSHEIRTPLNAVVGLANLLRKTSVDDRQRDYTEKMRHAAKSLLNIISDILDFSQMDAGQIKLEHTNFDMRQLLDGLEDFFREENAGSPVGLRFIVEPELPAALIGDARRLRQILINLLDNAYKFTPRGEITVRVAAVQRSETGVTLNFSVADTGIGMSQKQMDEIFSVFNQADNSSTRKYGGTGIGLTITRHLVALMGGEIAVASEEGKGTTFTFSCPFPLAEPLPLPLAAVGAIAAGAAGDGAAACGGAGAKDGAAGAGAAEGGGAPPADKNAILRGLRVLLVEDNEINAMIATELLTSVGIEVTGAENGKEALERLAEASQARGNPPFDLVLMDLQMPIMDGYEATRIIRGMPEYQALPIYALTAHALPEERERCFALGMSEHLTKPIDTEIFYEALRDVAKTRKPPAA
ncbi:MAG: response regulator [Peptococcaceae bacterium]|nr:response regulator [Peptococcaceae bacterium]